MLTKFLVVDCDSSYNVILGRPWIHGCQISLASGLSGLLGL